MGTAFLTYRVDCDPRWVILGCLFLWFFLFKFGSFAVLLAATSIMEL
jgi:hypothetical protein